MPAATAIVCVLHNANVIAVAGRGFRLKARARKPTALTERTLYQDP